MEGLDLEIAEPRALDVEETAANFAGNAALKAATYSRAADGGLAIASDGGLEVPALAGRWDPLLTHRQGQAKLRELAAGLEDRRVRWTEAIALAEQGELLGVWAASDTEGLLALEPWPASSGFWVWDIFLFPSLGKTWAQLSAAERIAVDHTWLALKRVVQGKLS